MNFDLDEAQRVIAESAAEVLGAAEFPAAGGAGPAESGTWTAAWQALAQAGLLALTLPGRLGGDDLGVLEAAVLLTEAGRRAAGLPALATVMLGALPITRWGSRELQDTLLAGVSSGETILTAALREPSDGLPATPATAAAGDLPGAGTVTGTKIGVPFAAQARWILVPAARPGGATAVVVIDASGPGVTMVPTPTSGTWPEYTVRLDDAPVAGVLGGGQSAVDDLYLLALAGAAAMADGALAGALALTASYVTAREQFGRPLATFQAVAGQAADIYIASRTLHLAALSACWRLSAGLDARHDAAVAAYWLASQAPGALRTCHQLHGGIGLDTGYPLHRYSALITDLARFTGGAEYRLEVLAAAAAPPDRVAGQPAAPAAARAVTPPEPQGPEREGGMFIELTADQRQLRDELRAYFTGLISAADIRAMRTDRHGAAYQALIRRMGRDGWLGVGWPREYGGRGFGQVEQQIFVSEAARADVPLPAVTLQTVGPTLQAFGTDEQKAEFLPKILAGEIHFAIGYTEPGAGTDLASLTTRALRDGDTYVVNGQKIFTTGAHDADYIWLACRTDPQAAKHKGISILIVDTADPGFAWTPIITCDGAHHVNATYYSDVRVPVSRRVGAENQGWRLVTTQLNHERVMLGPAGRIAALHDRVRDWAGRRSGPDGRPLTSQPDVRRALAMAGASLRVNELLNWQVAVAATVGIADASATKVFASEQIQRLGQQLIEVVSRHGDPACAETAELAAWLDVQHKRNLVLTFGGGVNEVQRELIATAGLGLPRVPR